MALFDDEPRKKAKPHEIGQDLALLSAGDLTERIALLRSEIERLEVELGPRAQPRTPPKRCSGGHDGISAGMSFTHRKSA